MPNNDNIDQGSGWFEATQKAVDAIREAGATKSWILLAGTEFTGGGAFKNKNFPALSKITDKTLGNTNLLAFDIHQCERNSNNGASIARADSVECTYRS